MDSEQKYTEVTWKMGAEDLFIDKMNELPVATRTIISHSIQDWMFDAEVSKYTQRYGIVIDDNPDSDSFYEIEVYHYQVGDIIFSDINEISCDEYLDHYNRNTIIESYESGEYESID